MHSVLEESVSQVVTGVLQNQKATVEINENSFLRGKWETDKQGNDIIGIRLYVNNKEVFYLQDKGTKIAC